MQIFKKIEHYEEVDVEPVKVVKKPLSQTVSEVKPKKKKEPPKPWGRKERLLVLGLLLLTSGSSLILAMSAREWKLPGLPRLVPSSLNIFKDKTIVIEGDNDYEALQRRGGVIEDKFNNLTKNLSGIYGIYVVDLQKDYSFGVNENEIFQAASLIKLPLLSMLYKESEEGRIDLDEDYKLLNSDKVGGAGSLYSQPQGYTLSYREMATLMGNQSDNTAFNVIRQVLTDAKITEYIKESGLSNTSLSENETTPADIGYFFKQLWKGKLVSAASEEAILNSLTDTAFESWIASGVSGDIRVSHKYGREVHVVNDAGVVFAKNPYILVVMSKGVVEKEADVVLPEISRMVYAQMIGEL